MFYSSCGSSNQSSHRSDHCAFSSAVFDQLWNHSADYLKENKIVSIHLTFYPSGEGIWLKRKRKKRKKVHNFNSSSFTFWLWIFQEIFSLCSSTKLSLTKKTMVFYTAYVQPLICRWGGCCFNSKSNLVERFIENGHVFNPNKGMQILRGKDFN